MKIEVSTRFLALRIVLFVVLFFVIVSSFTAGILSLGNKTNGYQTITAEADPEALTYNNLVHFEHWSEGSNNQIKRDVKQLKSVYTPILAAAYKQLDPVNVYTGQVSIGTINQNLGSPVSVSPELYAILKDAYRRTEEKQGFNMFAGALYAEWKSILILEDASEFDPLNNDYQASRIATLSALVSDLSNFKLEFLDDASCLVRLEVSEAYNALLKEYEVEAPVLDLNVLTDAYRLEMMAAALKDAGYRNGYLSTDEGLVLNLGGKETLDYTMYTLENGENIKYSQVALSGPFSIASLNAYGGGSDYGYQIEKDGRTYWRSLFFNPETGDYSNVIMSLTVISEDDKMVDDLYIALTLNGLKDAKMVEKEANALNSDHFISYILQ